MVDNLCVVLRVSARLHRTAEENTLQQGVPRQGGHTAARLLFAVEQPKDSASAARKQSAQSADIQQELTGLRKLFGLLRRAQLLKDILQRISNGRNFATVQGGNHLLRVRVRIGHGVTAGKGIPGADAEARLDNDDGSVRHGRQGGKFFPDSLCALGATSQTEGNIRPTAKANLFEPF